MRIELKRFQATNIHQPKDIEVPNQVSVSCKWKKETISKLWKRFLFAQKKTLTELQKNYSVSSAIENAKKTLTELPRRKGQSPWTRAWSSAPAPRWTCKHNPRPSGRFPGRSGKTIPRYGSWEKRDCRGTLRGKWFSWKQKRFPPPPEFVPVNGKVAESTLAFDPTFRNPNLCEPSWKLQFLSFLSQYTFDDDSLPQSLWTELEKIAIFIANTHLMMTVSQSLCWNN